MLTLPLKPKIIEKKGNFAVFEIEALYPGYGVTIGNSLRRVLLSSLPGAAITQVKIKGIQHEFSTIPGVLEDVISILLKLKQLRFKFFASEPQTAVLKVKGESEVKGSDFKLPSQVELVNKDEHLVTLTTKTASLEMEVQIEKGLGYEPVERRKKEKTEIGVILLDSIFGPIKKVSYHVENMRVGDRTDFDRLRMEIKTDGTISPEEAFFQASEILVNHFSIFSESFKPSIIPAFAKASVDKKVLSGKAAGKKTSEGKKEKGIMHAGDSTKIEVEDLKLSARTKKVLLSSNIKTVGRIIKKDEKGLLTLDGIGEKGVKEIKKALKKIGLELK